MSGSPLRWPDFVIIGTMKSGTTTLFRGLGTLPDVRLPDVKEPAFFSRERRSTTALRRYVNLFADVPSDVVTGEASVAYTDPAYSAVAAGQLRQAVPDARLVCVLRDPVQRLRSDYSHAVQRGRETRPFAEAIADANCEYLRRSRYAEALEPWLQRFPHDQLCIVRMEDLFDDDGTTWRRVVRHVGATPRPRPVEIHNRTADKRPFSPLLGRLYGTRLLSWSKRIPARPRELAGRLLLRTPGAVSDLLASARRPVSPAVLADLERDGERLVALSGDRTLTWPADPESAA